MKQTVLVIVGLSIALLVAINSGVSTVQAQTAFMPYGTVGQEDESMVNVNGTYWLNVVSGDDNGQFVRLDLRP